MHEQPPEAHDPFEELRVLYRGPTGIVGERLTRFHLAEKAHEATAIRDFGSLAVIGDSFFDFAIECFEYASSPKLVYHALRVPLLATCISRMRSSYILFWKGYYFDAVSLLRGVHESIVMLCSDAHGQCMLGQWFSFEQDDLEGEPNTVLRKLHNERVSLQTLVNAWFAGADSGLDKPDQQEIKFLIANLHSHVHRNEMHLAHLVTSACSQHGPARLLPTWNRAQASHYPHVFLYCAWMLERLLAYAVRIPLRSALWQQKHVALDRACLAWFSRWDKPLGVAICRLMEVRFSFEGEWEEPPSQQQS